QAPDITPRSLHDALPIFNLPVNHTAEAYGLFSLFGKEGRDGVYSHALERRVDLAHPAGRFINPETSAYLAAPELCRERHLGVIGDRKSTRLNSSHVKNTY